MHEMEEFVYSEMCRKMADFQTLTSGKATKANPKLTKLRVELAQVEGEIDKLIDTLMDANPMLLSYANKKIEELDTKRQALINAIAAMSVSTVSPEQMKRISGYLDDWDNVSFEDRRLVVDGLISKIQATNENIRFEWKI